MATTVTPKNLKARAPAFRGLMPRLVQNAIDEATRYISESAWGSRFDDGVFYLACHILEELASLGADCGEDGQLVAGETGAAVPAGPITQERILTWSASYATAGAFDDAFATTAWGRIFISRRELVFAARVL